MVQEEKPLRLQHRMAQLGVASRRESERLIVAGRVSVNGKVVTELGTKVTSRDAVAVDGKTVNDAGAACTLILNKPPGVICAKTDPQGRQTVYELLPDGIPHVGHVGRLDYNTEGVLLFTNVPGLADGLLRPNANVPRTYEVKIRGILSNESRRRLEVGIALDGRPTRPVVVERMGGHDSKHDWLRLVLFEGKNRHIHRIMEAVGHSVTRLRRVSFAGIDLDDMPLGASRLLDDGEIALLEGFATGKAHARKKGGAG
ncbi:MAG: rRNA pseudouridine synthase [Myxococcales bacterium]|nr:rRNA pseudouridine synthase [Myxococcales bacterium]